MYILQYWNPSTAEWRGAGCSSTSREVVERRMQRDTHMCDYVVRFRITHTTYYPHAISSHYLLALLCFSYALLFATVSPATPSGCGAPTTSPLSRALFSLFYITIRMITDFLKSLANLFSPKMIVADFDGGAVTAGGAGMLDKNLLFTSGVLLASGTGVAGAALLLSAVPAQVIGATATAAGLMYAGQRKYEGKPILPWAIQEGAKPSTSVSETEPAVQGVQPLPVTNFDGAEVAVEGL